MPFVSSRPQAGNQPMSDMEAVPATQKPRLLFIAEGATLAHIARPVALASKLDPEVVSLAIACPAPYRWIVEAARLPWINLDSQPASEFAARLQKGRRLYDEATLAQYVKDDLALFAAYRPDAVIGDFRLSLSVSARLARIPYMAISNAYWSPMHPLARWIVPHLPMTGFLPIAIADRLFHLALPAVFHLHTAPIDRVCSKNGVPSPGRDLRRVYTDADITLFADFPGLYPDLSLQASHRFIGPVVWSAPAPLPSWWGTLPAGGHCIYACLGSSGDHSLLPKILEALSTLDCEVLVATAGRELDSPANRRCHVAAYLPGDLVARKADVVICNGGSPTTQQAMLAGKPLIGICSNLDQFLNMDAVVRAGWGAAIRADRFSADTLLREVDLLARSSPSGSGPNPLTVPDPVAVFTSALASLGIACPQDDSAHT